MSESGKLSTLWHLETDFGIVPESFPERLGELESALDHIFGLGSSIVEKKLIEQICKDYKIPIDRATTLTRVVEISLYSESTSSD